HSRTWVVAHSGGDADSLSTACRLAASGDTIRIEAGRYVADHGFPPKPFILERNKALTILGPDAVRPMVTLVSHRLFLADCPGVTVRSVRFEGGESAIICDGPGWVSNCEFVDVAFLALLIAGDETSMSVVEDCLFDSNGSSVYQNADGGALTIAGPANVRRCVFKENVSTTQSAAIAGTQDTRITECVFVGNEAPLGAAIKIGLDPPGLAHGSITNCTFVRNRVTGGEGGALYVTANSGIAEVGGNIFYETIGGVGFFCDGGPQSNCNVFWNNEYGESSPYFFCETLEGQVADPLFCNPDAGDFRVRAGSPCLPGKGSIDRSCDLIGALGEGCSVSAVERLSWGRVKVRYGLAK
ncbi:MAG: right-handed parallel beta-helix repeat-containing protein, partial [Candidatus Eisenbacteria bacterium]|nr:right-handed parallel beta-helix repeat-containing protein [Candidatus Eisenbacteria bacterium]